ncbi:MAG: hypothetical protein P8174_09300 [Gemmatimonadota bacterium]
MFWFGLLIAVVGLGTAALDWYPLGLGKPEWEFGVMAMTIAGLPLPTMGLAAMLAAVIAQGRRRGVLSMAWVFLLLTLAVLAIYGLFLLVVPIALRGQGQVANLVVKKTIAKTSLMALGFSAAYICAAVAAFRHVRNHPRR